MRVIAGQWGARRLLGPPRGAETRPTSDRVREAVFNLWIPVKSASVFREAIARGVPHLGPYGSSSADAIYRVAVGSDGGDALVQPVLVAGKPVAVLCGDGMRHGARGVRRVEALAVALGDAFERLILHKKA